ncbi:hypothetical protein FUAX_32420 [Fulvitalea axinellae]|uniref:Uncharacterized protein n=1 Tax=Fulvitalea axinellae TaxID=1182444 RepID=A0AAU9DI59_9BACT|nr:hypothetical protein FUAX_32420 [Fulvitalea axinellae]
MNPDYYVPAKKTFILVMLCMMAFKMATHLPFLPAEVYGFPIKKVLKLITGIVFCVGVLWIYYRKLLQKN